MKPSRERRRSPEVRRRPRSPDGRRRPRSPDVQRRPRSPAGRRRSRSPNVRQRRSRSPDRRERTRERRSSPSRKRSRSREAEEAGGAVPKFLLNRPEIKDADLEGKTEEEADMMRLMGFGSFDTTKGKKVLGNDVSAVHVTQKRKYRQYMNRKGGFNRPLDSVN
ncbi:U4/U6.U5 small nuclear ribonucleoprotein 27 kDa protein [Halotydeus destructor]|nr:U4/U6.U5 small nuclear ribonucleoprotein 27 kDa protein [Halotydeus destructor]